MRPSLRGLAPSRSLWRRVDRLLAENKKLREQLASSNHWLEVRETGLIESQRQVQARLEEIEKIYNSAHIGLCVFDRYLRYSRVNERMAEMNCLPVAEHIGRTLREVVPEAGPKAEALAKQIFETGHPALDVEFEVSIPSDHGSRRVWISQWLPLLDAEGRVSGINVVVEDLTERKVAEERVRRSESMLYAALDNTPDILVIYDEDRRVEFINSSALRITGRPIEDFLGKRDEEIWPQEISGDYVSRLEACIEQKQIMEFELTAVFRVDTLARTLAVIFVPMQDDKGHVYQILAISRDVTVRKRVEQELERLVAERTAQLENLASQLHGRNAQLQAMALELTHAEQRERRQLAQILHDHLQQLLVGAKFTVGAVKNRRRNTPLNPALEQLEGLLNEAIETSRSLTYDLSPPILYQSGLADALKWLAGEMKRKHGLHLETSLDSTAEIASEALRILVFTAVRELLFNVVKHAKVDRATLTMRRETDTVRITVADRGAGFDTNQIRARGGPSAGFGLFSIEERLGLIGGKLIIESQPGAGSTFTLVAPADTDRSTGVPESARGGRRAESRAHATPPTAPGNAIRVILADDHSIMRNGLATLLSEQPDIAIIAQASNGQEAIDLCREHKPHVLVLDVAMPVMDGVQACQIISQEMPSVRIIGLSMFDSADLARPMLAAGADTYLTKAGPADQLLDAIRKCAHQGAVVEQV